MDGRTPFLVDEQEGLLRPFKVGLDSRGVGVPTDKRTVDGVLLGLLKLMEVPKDGEVCRDGLVPLRYGLS